MANPGQSRIPSYIYWAVAFVVLLTGGLMLRAYSRKPVPVQTAPVTYQTLRKQVSTNGKVEPVEEYQAHAPFPGVIQRIFVTVGDHVSKNQLLAQMDDSEARARLASSTASLSAAELARRDMQQGGSLEERNRFTSNINAAKLELQQAQSNLAAVQALSAKGSASAAEVAVAQQRLSAATLSMQSAQQTSTQRYSSNDLANTTARISEGQANLTAARHSVAGVNMRTPLSGTVYAIPVSQYDFVAAGEDILDVADLNRIQVRAYFDEPEIGGLARGQAVEITWDAKLGELWHGHIARAPTTVITYGTRNVGECIITVDDARGDLLPNTNVTVTVTELARTNVLSIPRDGLRTEGINNFVFRIVNGKLIKTPVQVGIFNNISVEITGGLSSKDIVALSAKSNSVELTDGLEVKPVE